MEESSEPHMDTGVSSTTDDVQEVPEVTGSHCSVETVVTVESVEEEDISLRNHKQTEIKTPEKHEIVTPVSKPHPEMTIKKIVIKSPLKDLQIRPIQKSPSKAEEGQKVAGNDISPNKPLTPSMLQNSQNAADSSSKVDSLKSPSKDVTKTVQSSTVNSSDSQKPVKKSPIKESPPQVSASKEAVPNSTLNNDQKILPKDPPVIFICKGQITKAPMKDQSLSSSVKEGSSKVLIIREAQSKTVHNETSTTQAASRDVPLMEVHAKQSPVKEAPVKESPTKQATPKGTQPKQVLPQDISTKEPSGKETVTKDTPKGNPVMESPAKQATAKSPAKEVATKQAPAKESPAKILAPKEQSGKTTTNKEPPPQTLATHNQDKPAENDVSKSQEKEPVSANKKKNISLLEDKEDTNDSQMETSSDTSEKEHNKSISRELRSLINSAKESKIISECTQLTSKTRKSRTPLDTSLNASVEAEKIQGVRRGSDNSQISNSSSSEKSEKTAVKRSMRSQNPEFVNKVKNFLNSVSGKVQKSEDVSDDEVEVKKVDEKESTPTLPKKKKTEELVAVPAVEKVTIDKTNKRLVDPYCWRCHWGIDATSNEKPQPKLHCTVCPRSYHFKCLSGAEKNKLQPDKLQTEQSWVCPECLQILQAESSETRSPAMKKISLGMLCDLLRHALERMMEVNGVEPFLQPVDRTAFPDYDNYVIHPMDLSLMKQHIDEGFYGSTEAFLADAQWILHNSIIFNTLQAKLTGGARALVRSCRAEMGEIEACPECYAAAHARRPTWFTDVCSTPHILLWAKLKGFPYWPAKGMTVSGAGLVDVRFFGAHDRAWVPARDCFLYSEKDPNNFRSKRQDILDSMQEAEQHIRNISRKYGKFVYPPFKTQFDPAKLNEQLKMMIPSFEGDAHSTVKTKASNPSPVKESRRSNSKCSKSSANDGDMSEGEENAVTSRKMPCGAEIARDEEDFSIEKEKEKSMEVDTPQNKEAETSRKRRRSELQEAVITIIDSTKEKRKRVESVDKNEKKDAKQKPENKEATQLKESVKPQPETVTNTKEKDSAPSTSTADKRNSPKVTPIRVISISKVLKNDKASPKVNQLKDEEKTPKQKAKPEKNNVEKDKVTPNEEKAKRRNSNKNKGLNNSNASKNDKAEKKNDKPDVAQPTNDKSKDKDNNANKTNGSDSSSSSSSVEIIKPTKDRIQFDDDTSLAILAKQAKNASNNTGLPTISSVRSLSSPVSTSTSKDKGQDVTIEAPSNSSIFTPTSTDNVRNMKEAVNKLQKLKEKDPPPPPQVGRVGVRAFARMTSPPQKETRPNDMQVEIKTEPVEFEETGNMQEKMDLMNAFKLRPVNQPSNLREVRINKVVVTPLGRKGGTPPQQGGMKAKKTFPQPKKPEEAPRSELTSKNSMVYIPIQPPMTQAPTRGGKQATSAASHAPTSTPSQTRNPTSINNTSSANNMVNTITPPLVSFASPITTSTSTINSTPMQTVAAIGQLPTMGQLTAVNQLPTVGQLSTLGAVGPVPTVGQVPTTVHTMPLITSVNGQWTFSLQPVLSVGGVDGAPSPPMLPGPGGSILVPAAGPAVPPAGMPPSQPNRTSNESTPGEPPRLQQRPPLVNPLDANAPIGCNPPPSSVGPLTAKLNQNAVKMTDFFRNLLEDSIERLEEPAAAVTSLKLQLEQVQWRHQQELDEVKHNHELMVAEMRSSFEKEKLRLVSETRKQGQMELDAAVKLAKAKQWCANCNQEAQFYCCWNTSYCDYPCQRAHWATHYAVCAQQRTSQDNNGDSNANPESRLQPAPDNLPKTTAAPNRIEAPNKLQPSRMYTQEQNGPQKTSIIVSMVEDNTGNQTMKCLGTYKPPAGTSMSPLIINKQIMSNEETAKKVVTSGGYLIVGAGNSTNSNTISPARRATAIQYIS